MDLLPAAVPNSCHGTLPSVRRRVIAIGLDSGDPTLISRYIASGVMPRIGRLRERGLLAVFSNRAYYEGGVGPQSITEGCWVEFQTGIRSNRTGYWTSAVYDPANYYASSNPFSGSYDYRAFPPFFALGADFRVAAFDVPISSLSDGVNGIQVLGWGGHYPFVTRTSSPNGLLEAICERYGINPLLYRDSGVFWNRKYLRWLESASIESIRTRTRICLDLMSREPWDLMLAVFGESHGASHDLWFAAHEDHPAHACWNNPHDPLAEVFRAIDDAVGAIAERVPDDCYFVLFSPQGSGPNVVDVAAFFLMPELLYRFNFPGGVGFAAGDSNVPPPPPILSGLHRTWHGEIWRRRHTLGKFRRLINELLPPWFVTEHGEDFRYPYFLDRVGAECGWMPSVWYRPSWPRMRSFSLPAFADGHVRINLRGRDPSGIVDPSEYEVECDRVTEFLLQVRNSRTGRQFIREIFRTRRSPSDDDKCRPDADLVAIFQDEPVDVVDSPQVGRVGPVPFYRTGGHSSHGFVIATGPGIKPGNTLSDLEVVDLGPTILEMLGARVPEHLDGRSWLAAAQL